MSSWHLAWQPLPSVYKCVCEQVNLTSIVKHFERSVDLKSLLTIYYMVTVWDVPSPLYEVQ